MGYSMQEYGRELTPAERREKALDIAVSLWGQWQWYKLRDNNDRMIALYRDRYIGAKTILNFAYDLTDSEIEDYCRAHVDWLLDDHALDQF